MNRTKALIATAAVPVAAMIPLSLASASSGHHDARLPAVRPHADSSVPKHQPTAAETALARRWYHNAVLADRWYHNAIVAERWYANAAAATRWYDAAVAANRWYGAAAHPQVHHRSYQRAVATAPAVHRSYQAPVAAYTPGSGRCGGNLPPCYVMMRESKGSLTARNPSSTAAGKWQFLASTWNGYGGYASAAQAPASVQDAKAAQVWAGGAGCSAWSAC